MYKKYVNIFFGICISIFAAFISTATILSIIEDRYLVFGILSGRYYKSGYENGIQCFNEPNQSFVKMVYLKDHPYKYDTYIFGSSRVGKIPNELLADQKIYNLTYSEGLPAEHLKNLKFLLKNKVRIKSLLMGLDEFSYRIDPQRHLTELLRIPHPAITDESYISFLLKYIRWHDYKFNEKEVTYDIISSGRPLPPPSLVKYINEHADIHAKRKEIKNPPSYPEIYRSETLSDIKNIISICKKNNIKLTFFINPVFINTYLNSDIHDFIRFKKELSTVTDFYDFAYINSITKNSFFYYDSIHYREPAGEMILEKLGYLPVCNAPRDFGRYVTQQTMESHSEFLLKNYLRHKNN